MQNFLSKTTRLTALINGLSALKIPLLAFCTPQVKELTADRARVRIRLDYRTKNHVGVMYFGALAMGAELSIALQAIDSIQQSGQKIEFIFKDFSCEFLKRADHHVDFVCGDVAAIRDLIERSSSSPERLEGTYRGFAMVEGAEDPIMTYKLTLSVRNRSFKVT